MYVLNIVFFNLRSSLYLTLYNFWGTEELFSVTPIRTPLEGFSVFFEFDLSLVRLFLLLLILCFIPILCLKVLSSPGAVYSRVLVLHSSGTE